MKIAIIGAGAAGCFAAANIEAAPDREVVLFEKTGKALQKVKVSGGGRCNVTHNLFDIEEFATRYPRGRQLLRKLLHRFSPKDTIEWFQSRGVQLKAEPDGRMFPTSDNAQQIIDCIWRELTRNGTQVRFHKSLQSINPSPSGLQLAFRDGSSYIADRVLIACGGFPKEEQYAWLRSLGHTIQPPVPSLFTFNTPQHPITALPGISVPNVRVKVVGTKISERGPVLITHWGLSGPAVLRASAWGARTLSELGYNCSVQINWLDDVQDADLKEIIRGLRQEQGKHFVKQRNPFGLPRRLWEFLTAEAGIDEAIRWGDLPGGAQQKLIEAVLRYNIPVKGKTMFKEEFVTCGGISLSEIDPATMQSKIVPGLHFAGEIIDVDGITGGFNFQHAWGTGLIAATAMVSP